MGINKQSDMESNLQIGPTDQGMVRIYVSTGKVEIPMDFDPDEADEIAEEIKASAAAARGITKK
jgi:ArsR family metal-binding transcriptional regulator